jgi:hypothetical protein
VVWIGLSAWFELYTNKDQQADPKDVDDKTALGKCPLFERGQ